MYKKSEILTSYINTQALNSKMYLKYCQIWTEPTSPVTEHYSPDRGARINFVSFT